MLRLTGLEISCPQHPGTEKQQQQQQQKKKTKKKQTNKTKQKETPRKQNLQANSRSAYQFCHKREKEAQSLFATLHIPVHSFCPKWLKLSFFSLYGQPFPRYRSIFKIGIFGLETGPLGKVSEVAHALSFFPRGRIWVYFHSTDSSFRDIGSLFKIATYGHEVFHWVKIQKLHIYLFLPQGVEIKLIFTLWAAVSELLADFQHCHICAWNLAIRKSSRSCTYTLFLPQGGRN